MKHSTKISDTTFEGNQYQTIVSQANNVLTIKHMNQIWITVHKTQQEQHKRINNNIARTTTLTTKTILETNK